MVWSGFNTNTHKTPRECSPWVGGVPLFHKCQSSEKICKQWFWMHVKGKEDEAQTLTLRMVGNPSAKFYKWLASVSHMYQLLRAKKGFFFSSNFLPKLLLLYVLRHLFVAIFFQNYFVLWKNTLVRFFSVWMEFMGSIYHLKFFNLNGGTNFEALILCNPMVKRFDSWQH